ncbi:MAG TPA: trigger factor [Chthonomonadales bacterium]|nr:trigger factor [Chthonomonadales bacterium]
MQVTKEQIDPCTVKLAISVDADAVNGAYDRAYRDFASVKRVPGFRPGKAPRSVVERYVDADALRERVTEILAPRAYREALKQEDIEPYADPEVDLPEVREGEEWSFTVTVPLAPKVELDDYSGLTVERPVFTVTDEDVEREVLAVREEFARVVRAEGRGVRDGDTVIAAITIAVEGQEPPETPTRSLIRVGHNIPGFDEQIVGAMPGEERSFELTYPEDFQETDRAGKKARFTVAVDSVNERVLPDATDEWVASVLPFQTIEELRGDIRHRLEERMRNLSERVTQGRIVEELLKRARMDFPRVMVDEQIASQLRSLEEELAGARVTYEQYLERAGMTPEQHRERMEREAEQRVRSRLVLRELARHENLAVSDTDIDGEFERMFSEAGTEEKSARRLKQSELRRTRVAGIIAERRIHETLMRIATIHDVPVVPDGAQGA